MYKPTQLCRSYLCRSKDGSLGNYLLLKGEGGSPTQRAKFSFYFMDSRHTIHMASCAITKEWSSWANSLTEWVCIYHKIRIQLKLLVLLREYNPLNYAAL